MAKVLDNSQRAKNITIGFYILAVVYAISLISDVLEFQLLNKGSFNRSQADANDSRQAIVAFLLMGMSLAVIIMFIQWFRRAYHNLHKAGVKGLNHGEGWAAGAWFVPIMSLFRPYNIMKEIWTKTKKYIANFGSPVEDGLVIKDESSSQVLGFWWAFWIISSISANLSNNIARNANTVSEFKNANMLSILSTITGLVAIYFVLKMIKASQNDQDKFYQAWLNRDNEDGAANFALSESEDILD